MTYYTMIQAKSLALAEVHRRSVHELLLLTYAGARHVSAGPPPDATRIEVPRVQELGGERPGSASDQPGQPGGEPPGGEPRVARRGARAPPAELSRLPWP